MPSYTYFIITPGYDVGSFVQYPDGKKGSYIKFGDQTSPHLATAGIRQAYLTHNPDIGVAAVMDSSVFAAPMLGTRLKHHIMARGYNPVGTSEWFSIDKNDAWRLFLAMQGWDNVVLGAADEIALQAVIDACLP